jgi:predicted DNA-binding transcriptional regulator YafY
VVLAVSVTNRPAFRSFVLGFLDHAQVLGPAELRAEMVEWLEAQCGV